MIDITLSIGELITVFIILIQHVYILIMGELAQLVEHENVPSQNTHFGDAALTVTSHRARGVTSSNLVFPPHLGRYTVSGSGADCKSAVLDSGGSTPSLPTNPNRNM